MFRFALIALLVVGVACSKKKSEPAPAASETPTAEEGGADKPAAADPNAIKKPQVRRVLQPVTVDEVKPMLPAVKARTVKEAQKAQVGERVEVSWCFDGELAGTGDAMKTALETAGWTGVIVRQNQKLPDRMNLHGRKEPFIVTGAVQKGAFADCAGDKNQVLVTLNIHKQAPRPAGAPGGLGIDVRPGVRPMGGQNPLGNPSLQRPVTPPVPPPAPAPAAPPAEQPKTP